MRAGLLGIAAVTVTLTIAASTAASAAKPVDIHSFDSRTRGPRSQVAVLGSAHLAGMPEGFQTAWLAPLIDRLAAWKPQVITVEGLSGEQCETLKRYQALYPKDTYDNYCWDTGATEKSTGLTVPAALAEIEKTLAAWPKDPQPQARRRLAMLFLAANDRASALVQWLRLAEPERHSGNGLDDAMIEILVKGAKSRNESYAIGSALAARLGLERVYPVDDHTSDAAIGTPPPGYEKAIMAMWSSPDGLAARKVLEARFAAAKDGTSVLELYRWINSPAAQRTSIAIDFGAGLAEPSPQMFGRQYVGWWEVRNLRMVANIRASFVKTPGARVLCVVGSSHKPYYESYLGMMHDVSVADIDRILR